MNIAIINKSKTEIANNNLKGAINLLQSEIDSISNEGLKNKLILAVYNINKSNSDITLGIVKDEVEIRRRIHSLLEILDDVTKELSVVQIIREDSLKTNKKLSSTNQRLISLFSYLDEQRDNEYIVEIGPNIAESLWKRGSYNTLELIGKIIENAAMELGDFELQCACLIEYIGWVLACQNKAIQGAKLIHEGVKLATSHEIYGWASKGERHLAAIEYKSGSYSESMKHLEAALRYINLISNVFEKNKQLAPTYYGFTELYIALHDVIQANKFHSLATNIYSEIDIPYKAVKLLAQRGKLAELEERYIDAKTLYFSGLSEAKKYDRNDGKIRNCYGLARIFSRLNDQVRSEKYKKEAEKYEKITPLVYV